jgi:hypothetical protein
MRYAGYVYRKINDPLAWCKRKAKHELMCYAIICGRERSGSSIWIEDAFFNALDFCPLEAQYYAPKHFFNETKQKAIKERQRRDMLELHGGHGE